MNPALRTLPTVALLAGVALLAAPLARADDDDMAGTRAGEGRAHPGRGEMPGASASADPSAESHGEHGEHQEHGVGHEAGVGSRKGQVPLVPGWTPSSLPVPERRDQRRRQAQDLPRSEQKYDSRRIGANPGSRATRVLPLGTGLALTGLGLGLAFFGLRLRRR